MSELFALLDKVKKGGEFVLRDDQYGFTDTLDAVKTARACRARFDLLDTGRFSVLELEWLCEAGAHFYGSDNVGRETSDLIRVRRACVRGRSSSVFLVIGPFEASGSAGPSSLAALGELGREGFILHASNREHDRDVLRLSELAEEAHKGGGFLVYYYHGAADAGLVELASRGAKIHLSDKLLQESDLELLIAVLKASRSGRSKLVLYIDKGMPVRFLQKLFDAGAVLLFKTPPSDRDSLMGKLERKARRRPLRRGTYYLHATFLI
jgi:hypothetical protein